MPDSNNALETFLRDAKDALHLVPAEMPTLRRLTLRFVDSLLVETDAPYLAAARPPTWPTFERLTGNLSRHVRSFCCNARIQECYRTIDTTAGVQLVYGCNQCCKLYVMREHDAQ